MLAFSQGLALSARQAEGGGSRRRAAAAAAAGGRNSRAAVARGAGRGSDRGREAGQNKRHSSQSDSGAMLFRAYGRTVSFFEGLRDWLESLEVFKKYSDFRDSRKVLFSINLIIAVCSLCLSGFSAYLAALLYDPNFFSTWINWMGLSIVGVSLAVTCIVGMRGAHLVSLDLLLTYFWGITVFVAPLLLGIVACFDFYSYLNVFFQHQVRAAEWLFLLVDSLAHLPSPSAHPASLLPPSLPHTHSLTHTPSGRSPTLSASATCSARLNTPPSTSAPRRSSAPRLGANRTSTPLTAGKSARRPSRRRSSGQRKSRSARASLPSSTWCSSAGRSSSATAC